MNVLVPVRYPLTKNSKSTLARGFEIAEEKPDSEVVVLHVNLFQEMEDVSRTELRDAVEKELGDSINDANVTYVLREGFLVEESILEVAANIKADVIVIGRNRSGRLRRAMRRLVGIDPDIEAFLKDKLDIKLEVVG